MNPFQLWTRAFARWQRTLASARAPVFLYVGFVLALAALLALLAWSRFTLRRQNDAANSVAHTYQVSDVLNEVLRRVLEVESSQRAFTISGKEVYLAPFETARAELPGQLDRLRALVRDNPTQRVRAEELAEAAAKRVELTMSRIGERRMLGAKALEPQNFQGQGPQLMERVRAIAAIMRTEEGRLLAERQAVQEHRRARSDWAQVALGLASVGLLGTVFYGLLDQIARARRAEEEARAAGRKLGLANEEVRAFSYSVAHDLRAPLRGISGFSDVLAEELGPGLAGEARDALERIQRNAARMDRIIDDLLALSKISTVEVRSNRINMSAMAREVCDELLAAGKNGRQIEVQLPTDLPPAAGDASLVRQVWVNLVGNALKFTRDRPTAKIEIGGAAAGPEFVNYYVRDNGAGFDMAGLGRLFGPFQRLHRADEFEGTGIGLALVKRIVQRHGGAVWAEGKEGEGAFFAFTLPEWDGKG